jgi:hypothetical protein
MLMINCGVLDLELEQHQRDGVGVQRMPYDRQ